MTDITVGYKQTEIGIIPTDWKLAFLGQNASIFRGGSPRPIEAFITNSPEGVNWIKIGDVSANAKYIKSTSEKINASGVKHSRAVKAGDLLLSNSMSYGRPYILCIDGCIHDGWLTISNYEREFDKEFLCYILGSECVSKQYSELAAGTGVKNLNKQIVRKVQLPYPSSIEEQRAIADALSDMDALIEAKTALLEKKRAIKQGAMQELLTGRRRLPGFAVTPMKKTDIGEIPEDWDVVNIKAVCNIDPDSLSSNTSPDFEFSYISLEGVSKGKLLNFEQKVFKLAPSRARKRPKEGDTLFGTVRPNLQSHYLFAKHAGEFVCSTGFAVLRPVSIYSNFLFQLVLSSLVSVQIDSMISGSNYPAVSSSDVGNLIIPYPKEQEQRAIATVLNDMDAEISVIDEEIIKLRNLKQGMMSELLTGRIRLVK